MVGAYQSAESFVSPLEMQGPGGKMDKNREAYMKMHDLYLFFVKNRIDLPEPLFDTLSTFINDVRRPVLRLSMQLSMEQAGTGDPERILQVWTEAVEVFKRALPTAKARIEQEFRQILVPTP